MQSRRRATRQEPAYETRRIVMRAVRYWRPVSNIADEVYTAVDWHVKQQVYGVLYHPWLV